MGVPWKRVSWPWPPLVPSLETTILSSFLHKASHDALTHSGQETLYPVDHRWSLLKLRVRYIIPPFNYVGSFVTVMTSYTALQGGRPRTLEP